MMKLIALLVIAVCAQELTVRDFGPSEADLRVVIVCGQHPREAFSRVLCERWALLLERYPPERVRVVIVPDSNPDGTALWATGADRFACWRGNARGVDLNRNWPPLEQCVYELDTDASVLEREWSHGETPFSEWETRALDRLLRSVEPDLLLNVHTGALALLTPYDACGARSPVNRRDLVRVANWLRSDGVCEECVVGGGAQVLYPAAGTLIDYAHHFLRVPLVYTLEAFAPPLRPVGELTPQECRRLFSPNNQTMAYVDHARRWDRMIYRLAHPDNDNMETLLEYAGVLQA